MLQPTLQSACRMNTLEDIDITSELSSRSAREPDFKAENEALVKIVRALETAPETILQVLVDTALSLCDADSAGISIEEMDGENEVFRWHATAGVFAPFKGGTLPRRFSPCGVVLDRNEVHLMEDPERFYPYIANLKTPIREVLLTPFYRQGVAIGTIWIISHTNPRPFDKEDLRVIETLARFVAAGTSVLSDISVRKTAEIQLRALEQKQAALLTALPVACYTLDENGFVSFYNEAAVQLFGRQPEIGRDRWCCAHELNYLDGTPVDKATCATAVALSEQRSIRGLEAMVIRPDGSRRWIVPHPDPLFDASGKLIGLINVVFDVTEQRAAEMTVRENAAYLESIMGATTDCVKVLELDGRLKWMSENGKVVMEVCDFSSIKDKIWQDFWADSPTHLEAVAALKTALEGGAGRFRGFCPTCAGTAKWWDVIVTPIRDANQKIVNILSVSRDITAMRQTEEALRSSESLLAQQNRNLEQRVAERTATIDAKFKELEAFSYSISHDLRAPLRAMQSYAQLLADEFAAVASEEARDYSRRIITASDRMDRLISDVLVISRVAQNETPLERIALGSFISGIVETYPQFTTQQTEINVTVPLHAVRANPALLTQCVSNLLSNAIKFVPAGTKPKVKIWTEATHGRVNLFIQDNGIGIPAAAQQKIFDIFYQITPNKEEGTGIGLAVVRKAVERMGGSIKVESTPGNGCTFCVELESAAGI
ncbi:ATP-binding protein [Rariglobus hedericola]|uniref:histidine kinase n=1 Tax=Rariglobus hedericola TaxID=2597822 RepID=A0A556QN34_9BACT|nr:ATP-binding protein [Rariglobus hedericola]TSJ78044.1 PAS domain S-box protein [Rariglobus hedericola]